jgi:hypothetical protein
MPHEARQADAVIEFSGEDPPALEKLASEYPAEVVLVRAKGFDAAEYTLQALVAVVPLTIRLLAPIIRAHIESGQRVRVKVGGDEFEGRPDDIIKFLKELSAADDHE